MRSSYNRIASLAFACLIGLGSCGIAGAEAQCFTDSRNCSSNSYCSNFTSNCNQYDFGYTYSSGCSSRWNARCRKVYRRGQCSTVPTCRPTSDCAATAQPTAESTSAPTAAPTAEPTVKPTSAPTSQPTAEPTVKPTAEPTAAAMPTTQPDQGGVSTSMAQEVLSMVNEERAAAGLNALTMDDSLSAAAYVRAREIVTSFSHTRPDGSSFSTVTSGAYGENIAKGQQSAARVMAAWMSSSGHRANILNSRWSTIGICAYEYNGVMYWVQLFGR